ncbi:unnamed protein product, partial [Arabidopsis halleri]
TIGGLHLQIQHTLNLFRPLTISEAHQQALTVEAQTKGNFSSWSASRPSRPASLQSLPAPAVESQVTKQDSAIVPFDNNRGVRTGTLRCFACGEAGHRQSACPTRNRRGLLLDESGNDVEVIYDEEPEIIEDLSADVGSMLIVRRVCLTPRAQDEHPQ